VIAISKANLTATVEPGVVLQDLNTLLAKENLFYPPDPQSFLTCTIGGTIAENSGGPLCIKYGVTKHYVLGLEVVLPDGYIMNIGGSTVKNRTGYDLVPLFTGSEGTLGIITKSILRLIPKPAARKTMMAIFDDMTLAGNVVSRILAKGIVPAKVEFVDNFVIRRIEEKMQIGLPMDAKTMLLIEADGSLAAVESEAEQILELLTRGGARIARLAKDDAEAMMYWKARSAGFAYRRLLTNRPLLGRFLGAASLFQSAFMPKSNGIIRHLPSFMSALSKGRQIPSIASKFLRQQAPAVSSPNHGARPVMRVGYFTGCQFQLLESIVRLKKPQKVMSLMDVIG